MPYAEARPSFTHPIAGIDCHDPATMALRVTRPGFLEGIRALKASQGVKDYDVNTMATRQEMRSYVCGQCHVEYYFKGDEKRLTYPWAKGLQRRRERRSAVDRQGQVSLRPMKAGAGNEAC
jgi:nitrite reductase (cytochrome c-552)